MNPVLAAKDIEKNLQDYIRRTLPVERADPAFTGKLDALFAEPYLMAQDPYLELMPPYRPGASLQQLVQEDVICQETANIFAKAFLGEKGRPADFVLHSHQEAAIRAVCKDQQNLVVCSGTGSGKTECFLIPLVDFLVRRQSSGGNSGAGVQAMILYPMNALVNDQVRRLRSILRYAPQITFGKYTGELDPIGSEEEVAEELEDHAERICADLAKAAAGVTWSGAGFDDEAPLPNEITRRSQWSDSPAQILVTNYSMLELLLLRPETSNLFQSTWKFIILDEAHCYDGALGTEIAWLVRRLKHRLGNPNAMRFMATSATLISDPALSDAQKAEIIRNEFASKLFPAEPQTFAVQFGDVRPYTPLADAHKPASSYSAELYRKLAGRQLDAQSLDPLRAAVADFPGVLPEQNGLVALTQAALGAERWVTKLQHAAELAEKVDGTTAAGDALYVLSQVKATLDAGLLELPNAACAHLKSGFLDTASLPGLKAIIEFVRAGIGPLDDYDAWRKWLHDHTDPRPSSIATDTYVPANHPANRPPLRNRRGNRLHLLAQWEHLVDDLREVLTGLTVDGFFWLLKIAAELAVEVADELPCNVPAPMNVGVTFSAAAREAIRAFFARRCALDETLAQRLRPALVAAWRSALSGIAGVASPPESRGVESLLAWFLGADKHLGKLVQHLETAMQQPELADHARIAAVAAALFEEAADRQEALVDLITMASLAVPGGKGRPLVDIRYHQLLRGLREIGISFSARQGEDPPDFHLHADDRLSVTEGEEERAMFTLGVCRNCGQPFAMGYSDVQQLTTRPTILSRMRSESHKYLHAIAWQVGNEFDEAEENFPKPQQADVWLNLLTGSAMFGAPPTDGQPAWLQAHWYVGPGNQGAEFLACCPCCGDRQQNITGTRFGIITPFAGHGEQFRLVLLDELSRATDVSFDPTARRHPGDGRKVLAFSDSRQGAARLAFRFQELFNDVTLNKLVLEAAQMLLQTPLDPTLRETFRDRVRQIPEYAALPEQILDAILAQELINRGVVQNAVALRYLLERDNCARLLEISGEQGGDLEEGEAARLRLLQALHKTGRQTVLRKKKIRLESKALAAKNWNQLAGSAHMSADLLKAVAAELHLHLFETIRLQQPTEWPFEMVSGRWSEPITREKFERGRLRRIAVRRALIDNLPPDLEAAVRTSLQEAAAGGNAITRAACLSIAAYQGDLRPLLREAFLPKLQGERISHFMANAAQGATRGNVGATGVVKAALKKPVETRAANVLPLLWPPFTQESGGSRVLTDAGNGNYVFNWEDLNIFPNTVAVDVDDGSQPETDVDRKWNAYDEYLAVREIIPVRIEEHTAQIAKKRGAAYQKAFASGLVNILSCSTTFEMGVDLGDLTCLFLANLPPSVANYRQRAGRAGRRPGSAAYVLSFIGESPHDQYYFERPAQLLFGPVQSPRIYLENRLFLARHLRAEALHYFLEWMRGQWKCAAVNPQKSNELRMRDRNWKLVGDFFAGRNTGRVTKIAGQKFYPITGVFEAIAAKLTPWHAQQADFVQAWISGIDDVPKDLGYGVAADLVWQLLEQTDQLIVPYPLNNVENVHFYRQLAGPNQPETTPDTTALQRAETNSARREVGRRVRDLYEALGTDRLGANQGDQIRASLTQGHLLHEQTITWLGRSGVLPKYGFPVDVIRLLPDSNDAHGRNVELERDLKIALYEYAPGQAVIADKRIYLVDEVCAFLPGGLPQAVQRAERALLCVDCHEPHWELPAGGCCIACRGALQPHQVVRPDAFQAEPSFPAAGRVAVDRSTPLQIYPGGDRNRQPVADMRLEVAESESGELIYLNFGPQYQGFRQGRVGPFSLFHRVKTDIAVWLPESSLYLSGQALARLRDQALPDGGNRLRPAMQSALQAIIRAAALHREVAEREIGGLLHPDQVGFGMVLFDESSGGGGAVLPLVLTGQKTIDAPRHRMIRQIVEKAKELCEGCPECNAETPFADIRRGLPAIPRESYLNLRPEDRERFRQRQSCYKCLRSYKNQRVHDQLDRGDAHEVLAALLDGTTNATAGFALQPDAPAGDAPVTKPTSVEPAGEEFILQSRPLGMPPNRQPPYRFRSLGSPRGVFQPARLHLVRLCLAGGEEKAVGRIQALVHDGQEVLRFCPANETDNIRNCDIVPGDVLGLLLD